MGRKKGLRIVPVIIISITALFGGYFLGSYMGTTDISDLLLGLSYPTIAKSRTAYIEYKKASTVIAKRANEIKRADQQKKKIEADIKKIQTTVKPTVNNKKKIVVLKKKINTLQTTRVKKQQEIKKAQTKQGDSIRKITEQQKKMTSNTYSVMGK